MKPITKALGEWIGFIGFIMWGAISMFNYQTGNIFMFYVGLSLIGLFAGLLFHNRIKIEESVDGIIENSKELADKALEILKENES